MSALLTGGSAHGDRAAARKLVEDARELLAKGNKPGALRLCERAIAKDSDYRPAHEMAAPLWLAKRDYSAVIRHFERLTLRYPAYAHGWYTLAYAYRLAGRAQSAIASYELYIDMRPNEAAPHFGLAMAYKSRNRPNEAIAAFQRYVQLERDPARGEFVAQARREVAALVASSPSEPPGSAPPPPTAGKPDREPARATSPPSSSQRTASSSASSPRPAKPPAAAPWRPDHPELARARALIAAQRLASAEAVLDRFNPDAVRLRQARDVLLARVLAARGRGAEAAALLRLTVAGTAWDGSIYARALRALGTGALSARPAR